MSDTEYDLDALTSMLEDEDDVEAAAGGPVSAQPQSSSNTSALQQQVDDFDDDLDMDALAGMLEEEAATESAAVDKNISVASLGLEMSDDEDNNTNNRENVPKQTSFSAAFSNLKKSVDKNINKTTSNSIPSKKVACLPSRIVEEVDPLEKELRDMEERMNKIKSELAKKKKLDMVKPDGTPRSFTKLAYPTETREQTKLLTSEEKQRLLKRLRDNRKSVVHGGDTDSEDDEDNMNPFETQYNSYGKTLKKNLAAAENNSYSNRNKFTDNSSESSRSAGSGSSADRSPAASSSAAAGSATLQALAQKRQDVLEKLKSPQSWQGVSGSLVSLKGSGGAAMTEAERNAVRDPYSGIYIMNPSVSTAVLQERMEGRRHVSLTTIPLHIRGGEVDGDWVTIAVLVAKSQPKTSQKGSQYSIWQLNDLRDCTKSVGLFLFAGAHSSLWKTSVGTVLGLLNAQVMKDREGESSNNLVTLSVNNPLRVMVMGTARDLGWCKGRTKAGAACRQFVNKSVCEFCVYHVQREYQKTSSKRSDLQSSFSAGGPKSNSLKQKVLGKDQVFYGGQLYNGMSSAPVLPPKQNTGHKSKDLATLSSLKLKMKSNELKENDRNAMLVQKLNGIELMEKDHKKMKEQDEKQVRVQDRKKALILKHLSQGEISAVREMVKQNDSLGERLLAPTPGARNLLRHKTREEEQQTKKEKEALGIAVSLSAKDLLKMTHKEIRDRKLQQQQRLSQQTASTSSSQQQPSSARLSLSAVPTLGRGLLPGQDIELDVSPQQKKAFDPVKAKALAILKRKGETLKAAEKNSVRNKDKTTDPEFREAVQKRLRESLSNESVDENQGSSSKKSKFDDSGRSLLGNVNLNTDKIKAMLEKKSRHSNLVDAEEDALMEKYYHKLEQKEMLEEKMASIMSVPTNAVICKICKYQSVVQSQYCKEEGHPVQSVKATKRFFECSRCKRRTVSLEKMPGKACTNCDGGSWKRVAMGKARKGPTLESEVLCLRGNEQKHYGGGAEKAFLNIDS